MKTQYTPGPWKIEMVGAAGFPQIVCRDHAKFDGAVIATEICNGEANARLIAAAPELLSLLLEVYDTFTDDNYNPPNHKLRVWLDQTKAVILKATTC